MFEGHTSRTRVMCKGTSSTASICRSDSLAVPSYLDPRSPAWLNNSNPDRHIHCLTHVSLHQPRRYPAESLVFIAQSAGWTAHQAWISNIGICKGGYISGSITSKRASSCVWSPYLASGLQSTLPKKFILIELRSSRWSEVATRATGSCCVKAFP